MRTTDPCGVARGDFAATSSRTRAVPTCAAAAAGSSAGFRLTNPEEERRGEERRGEERRAAALVSGSHTLRGLCWAGGTHAWARASQSRRASALERSGEKRRGEQRRAEESRAEQSRAEQSRAEQISRAEQRRGGG